MIWSRFFWHLKLTFFWKKKKGISHNSYRGITKNGGRQTLQSTEYWWFQNKHKGLNIISFDNCHNDQLQDVKGIYAVKSSDEKSEYAVSIISETWKLEQVCVPHCIDNPCDFLCRHMVKCTRYDYQHGHLAIKWLRLTINLL